MPNPSSISLTFYPAYCLPLSPTYNTWARLTAADVHVLQERKGYDGQGIYFHLNHPIKWVRLVGVVIALDFIANRWLIQLDDSSGATIVLICERQAMVQSKTDVNTDHSEQDLFTTHESSLNSNNVREESKQLGRTATGRTVDLTGVDIGAVVKVKGGLGEFRGEKQVLLERISLVDSTNDEVALWAENSVFRGDILNVPWLVKEHELKRAARKAEGRGCRRKESKPKHGNDKDRGLNRDRGKESGKIRATVRQKPEEGKNMSARIKGREVRIPPDQERLLGREDSWLPAEPDQTANITAAREQELGSSTVDLVAKQNQPKQSNGRYDALGL